VYKKYTLTKRKERCVSDELGVLVKLTIDDTHYQFDNVGLRDDVRNDVNDE